MRGLFCFWILYRRLVAQPSKHHAIHLSEVSKAAANAPAGLLQTYKKSKAAGFSEALTYSASLLSAKSPAAAAAAASAGTSSEMQSQVQKFDTFEEIERAQGENSDAAAESHVRGKAARFKV